MKEELKKLLGRLSEKEFGQVKQLYSTFNKIKGDTIDEFVNNCPDNVVQGVIKLCNKQLGI